MVVCPLAPFPDFFNRFLPQTLLVTDFADASSLVDYCFPDGTFESEAYEMIVSTLARFFDFSEVPVDCGGHRP